MFKSKCNINSNIIFIDIDDTICDTRGAFIKLYEKVTGEKVAKTNVRHYEDMCPLWSQDKEISSMFKNGKDVYSTALPIVGAKEGIQKLTDKGFEIMLVTLNFPESVYEKQKWVDKHFPELSHKMIVLTSVGTNKDIFKGFAIIDDDMKNIKSNPSEYPILLDIYKIYDDVKYAHKYSSWKEIIDKF